MAPHRFVLAVGLGLVVLSGCTRVSSTTQLAAKDLVPPPAVSNVPAAGNTAERPRLLRSRTLFVSSKDSARKATPAAPAIPVPTEDLIAVGYASITAQPSSDVAERRLMAARASRIDAYRNMAELVYGVTFGSESATDDSRLRNDVTRTRVAGHLQGVEVISIEPLGNDTYQTTLRLTAGEVARLRSATGGQ